MDRVTLQSEESINRIVEFLLERVFARIRLAKADRKTTVLVPVTETLPQHAIRVIRQGTWRLFEIWRTKHPDLGESELLSSFEQSIRSAVAGGALDAVERLATSEHKEPRDESVESVFDDGGIPRVGALAFLTPFLARQVGDISLPYDKHKCPHCKRSTDVTSLAKSCRIEQ